MPTLEKNETILDKMVTTTFLCRMFSRTALTILHWRTHEGLPFVRIKGDGRDTIRFELKRVRAWADRNGKEYTIPENSNEDES